MGSSSTPPIFPELHATADKALREHERRVLAWVVQRELENFPHALTKDENLPIHQHPRHGRMRLFPLGEYREVYLGHLSGRTILYMGSDQRLYEYGFNHIRVDGMGVLPEDNLLTIRAVDASKLSTGELILIRDLLRRVWLV